MMLDHLGETAAAASLMTAVERVTVDGSVLTLDLGGDANTGQVTDAVVAALSGH
jgi:tartrate dehydrogenase/decarboxylase/D-malate dehydrogenase